VLDNDVVVQMALEMTWHDVDVIECARVSDAFTLGLSERPDCFVVERRLPDGDGLDVVRRLRCDIRTNQIPIVATTAMYHVTDEPAVLKAGADVYLAKPFEPSELLLLLEGLLSVPASERRTRRQRSISLLRDGLAPEPLIDLRDGSALVSDWREEALRRGGQCVSRL
jgi:DNA-binding response OmpR family regulator